MRQLGDSRLLDHPGGTFEGVRQAQQASHDVGRGSAFLELQDPLRQPIKELSRLDAEILVVVLRHFPLRIRLGLNQPHQIP